MDSQFTRGLKTEASIKRTRIETNIECFDTAFDDYGGDGGDDDYEAFHLGHESNHEKVFSEVLSDGGDIPELCNDEVDEDDILNAEDDAQNELDCFGVKELLLDSGNSEGKVFESKFPKIVIMVSEMFSSSFYLFLFSFYVLRKNHPTIHS
jgi:hypothetical protein